MAVSGTTTFTVTRDQVIEAAMRGLSVLEEGATPSATSIQNASFAINLIIKNWQKDGIKLWTISDIVIPLTSGVTTYTIGPVGTGAMITSDKPLKLVQSFLRNTSVSPVIDIPMQKISRQEYNMLGSKFSTGTTNSVFLRMRICTIRLHRATVLTQLKTGALGVFSCNSHFRGILVTVSGINLPKICFRYKLKAKRPICFIHFISGSYRNRIKIN